MQLTDKIVIVTGAASGIGQEVACSAARAGATVVGADIAPMTDTLRSIEDAGGNAIGMKVDIRRSADWAALMKQVEADHGGVDMLANVAGIVNRRGPDTVVDLEEEWWDDMIDTNLRGTWLGMRAVIPSMIARGGGRIVNIASMAALRGLPNLASYTAAKGGVAALTRQAAIEYAPHNVLINAIAPGTVDTPILAGTTDAMKAHSAQSHAIKRLGRPIDIAAMAMHFFSPEHGSWLTGSVMPVDGGWHVT